MPDDQAVTSDDPGLGGVAPSEEELLKEEEARSGTTVAEMVQRDREDPHTPNSFEVPHEDGGPSDAR